MTTIGKFTDLIAWQEAHKLTILTYKCTGTFPKSETFGLTSQLNRAGVSIESCIAEGFSRFHYKDRLTFYYDARGSIAEHQSQSITALDLGYLTKEQFDRLWSQSEKTAVILGGLIRSTQALTKRK